MSEPPVSDVKKGCCAGAEDGCGCDSTAAKGAATVYVDGIFDMFHLGHVAFLRKALKVGGEGARLVVGIITDDDARWKRKPIMTHTERIAMVRACYPQCTIIEQPPIVLTEKFLDDNGITLVVHGDDSKQEVFFAVPIARGIMRYVPYEKGISTSDIIARILARGDELGGRKSATSTEAGTQ